MFKHVDGDNAIEILIRNCKVIFPERIDRFIQQPRNLIVVFAGNIGPRPLPAVLTEVPVERSIVVTARYEQTVSACRFAKQIQERLQLLLFLD
jgi:hypothetical protein